MAFPSPESSVELTQAVPVSPTLLAEQRYISVLAKVPDELANFIVKWRQAQPEIMDAGSVHITILVAPESQPVALTYRALKTALQGSGRVQVKLGEPASFEPVTAVSYLPLQEGGAELAWLNRQAERAVGAGASPFEYHPHVTLAQHVSSEVLERSMVDFKEIPEHLANFELSCVRVYVFDGHQWGAIGSIDL